MCFSNQVHHDYLRMFIRFKNIKIQHNTATTKNKKNFVKKKKKKKK